MSVVTNLACQVGRGSLASFVFCLCPKPNHQSLQSCVLCWPSPQMWGGKPPFQKLPNHLLPPEMGNWAGTSSGTWTQSQVGRGSCRGTLPESMDPLWPQPGPLIPGSHASASPECSESHLLCSQSKPWSPEAAPVASLEDWSCLPYEKEAEPQDQAICLQAAHQK